MREIVDVLTGEVKAAGVNSILKSAAIGSCIVVAAFYPQKVVGAMAHVMLPGKASEKNEGIKFRYAEDAINELLLQLNVPAKNYREITICLIGAGNVLKREDDSICQKNIGSVLDILAQKKLKVEARALGGMKRRSARFDVARGEIYFTEDGSEELLLWRRDA
ncbi:MAG: chemotaxis protein CheD [Prolixibacteraceae bacterium]|nr:chemotaxis protein CheD [Prolixibacteraceae bacterium]